MNGEDLKPRIQSILERHQGRNRAITRRELRDALQLTIHQDRKLRLTIGEMRHDGFPILFATQGIQGYYLPESLAELQEGIRQLRSYIIAECLALRDFKVRGSQYVTGAQQGKLL